MDLDLQVLPDHVENPDPDLYLTGDYIVLDFETTNIDKGSALNMDNHVVLTVWGRNGAYKSIRGDEYEIGEVVKICEEVGFVVAQNAKFELQWLKRAGADLTKIVVWDTMLGKYVEDGNRHSDRDLESLVKYYGATTHKGALISKMMKGGVCPSQMPASWLLSYCEDDVAATEEVFLAQRKILHESGLLPVMYTRCLMAVALADIEFNGMHLDEELVKQEYVRLCYELGDIEKQLQEVTGGINARSPKQVGEFLFETLKFDPPRDRQGNIKKTASGNYPASAAIIANLKPRNKKQKKFLDLKKMQSKLSAALTKNIEFFMGACKEKEGMIYAQFNQAIAKTHRLTSSGRSVQYEMFDKPKSVQFQNMPRIYKPLFRARKDGWLIGEIDQAQLEFRVAAELGNDDVARQEIADEFDVHSYTASIIYKVELEWMLENKESDPRAKEMRQNSKGHTFKPLFGGKSGTKAEVEYYEAFARKYAAITETQESWAYEVVDKGYLTLPTGLRCYWPGTEITSSGYITNSTQIYNLPIQNIATAEIVQVGVVYQWHRMKAANMESFLVNTIHDSSIGEVHPDEQELYSDIGRRAFVDDALKYLKDIYDMDWHTPLEAEVEYGKWWGSKECDDCGAEYSPVAEHICSTTLEAA